MISPLCLLGLLHNIPSLSINYVLFGRAGEARVRASAELVAAQWTGQGVLSKEQKIIVFFLSV